MYADTCQGPREAGIHRRTRGLGPAMLLATTLATLVSVVARRKNILSSSTDRRALPLTQLVRRSLVPAALVLLLSTLTSACVHQSPDASAPLTPDEVAEPDTELDGAEHELDIELAVAPVDDPNVITFNEDESAGPVDMVIAPPKREDIPGFALFGTGESMEHDGPKLTLPDDIE